MGKGEGPTQGHRGETTAGLSAPSCQAEPEWARRQLLWALSHPLTSQSQSLWKRSQGFLSHGTGSRGCFQWTGLGGSWAGRTGFVPDTQARPPPDPTAPHGVWRHCPGHPSCGFRLRQQLRPPGNSRVRVFHSFIHPVAHSCASVSYKQPSLCQTPCPGGSAARAPALRRGPEDPIPASIAAVCFFLKLI